MTNKIKKSIEIIWNIYNLEKFSYKDYNEIYINKNDPSLFIYNSLSFFKCKDYDFHNENLICKFIVDILPKLANYLCKLENFGGFMQLPTSLVYGIDDFNFVTVKTISSQNVVFNNVNSFFKSFDENLYFREIIIEKNDLKNNNYNRLFYNNNTIFPYLIDIFQAENKNIYFCFRAGIMQNNKKNKILQLKC